MIPLLRGRLSYTAPKFPQYCHNIMSFNNILNLEKSAKIGVVLDWLSIYFEVSNDAIKTPEQDDDVFSFETASLTFQSETTGTQHFRFRWKVLIGAEQLGTLISHSRNEKFFKKNTCKLDFANHLFYSDQTWTFYQTIVKELGLKYKSISRADIALDGANYLIDFFNEYLKQPANKKVIELLGRPKFAGNVYDRHRSRFENFKFGKMKSGKEITIYNKSLDIVNRRKDYIQEWWKINGIVEKIMPIEELHTPKGQKNERICIPGYPNIYRFEMRMSGEVLQEIDNFQLELLQTQKGLMSILRLMTRNYFQAIWMEYEKTTKCTTIDLLPFSRFKLMPLQKVELKQRGDLYKATLSIHKNIKQLYTGALTPDNASAWEMIVFDVKMFGLQRWFHNKIDYEWKRKYSALNRDKDYTEQVNQFINELKEYLPIQEE